MSQHPSKFAILAAALLLCSCSGQAEEDLPLTGPDPLGRISSPALSDNWPSFRGLRASGIAENQDLPLRWDVKTGENIRWTTPIPGLGHSSPVVWEDKIFITTAVGEGKEPTLKVGRYGSSPDNPEDFVHHYRLYCLDKNTGEILWERTPYSGKPKIDRHVKSSHANCTPAVDGRHVIVFFGSQGLYGYSLDGERLWSKDLGLLDAGAFDVPEIRWGFGSSPVIHENRVIVQCDVNNQSFIASLDVSSGEEIWRTLRDEQPGWGTPTVFRSEDRTRIYVNGYKHIGGYDFETGKEIWWMHGGGDIPCPTPVIGHGLVFITNAHGRMRPIYAIKLDAVGDISLEGTATSNAYVAWSYPRRGSYQPTPLVYGDHLYICDNSGMLACYDAGSGKEFYREKLGGELSAYSASPVAADGRLFFPDEYGNIHIVKAGPRYEHLAVNTMDEICMASPAVSGKTLFIRTAKNVYAVGRVD